MTISDSQAPELPLRRGGDPLSPRLSMSSLTSGTGRLVRFRYPNGVCGWVTTRAEDFRTVLTDRRFEAKWFGGGPQTSPITIEVPEMPGFIPAMNGPEHLRVRRLAAADFSVKRIEELRPLIEQIVAERLAHLVSLEPPVDLIEEYCLPIPSVVIGHILGVPERYGPDFQKAANETIGGRTEGHDDPQVAARAVGRLHEILGEVIESKRRVPTNDLITRLTQASGPPLSDEEIKGLCTNLLLAGHDTTAANAALGVTLLLDDPDRLATFCSDPERVAGRVEEIIRFNNLISDAAQMPRQAAEDVEVAGRLVRKGEWVMPSVATANADPAVCPHAASVLDLDRSETGVHLSFGFGAHTCLGQHLARAELQIMLLKLFERLPGLQLAEPPDQMDWNEDAMVYRMTTLPVRW